MDDPRVLPDALPPFVVVVGGPDVRYLVLTPEPMSWANSNCDIHCRTYRYKIRNGDLRKLSTIYTVHRFL